MKYNLKVSYFWPPINDWHIFTCSTITCSLICCPSYSKMQLKISLSTGKNVSTKLEACLTGFFWTRSSGQKKNALARKWNSAKSTRFLATIKWTCFRRYWSLLIRLNELKLVKVLCKLWSTIKNTLNHYLVVHCYVPEEIWPACKDICLKKMSR